MKTLKEIAEMAAIIDAMPNNPNFKGIPFDTREEMEKFSANNRTIIEIMERVISSSE